VRPRELAVRGLLVESVAAGCAEEPEGCDAAAWVSHAEGRDMPRGRKRSAVTERVRLAEVPAGGAMLG
jgi:hypothetical protein